MPEKPRPNSTTIMIPKSLSVKINKLKIHKRETKADVLERLILFAKKDARG